MRFYYAINHRAILSRHKSLSHLASKDFETKGKEVHCIAARTRCHLWLRRRQLFTTLRFAFHPKTAEKNQSVLAFFSLLHASQAICAIIFRAQFAHRLLHRAPRRENELMECYETLFPVSEKRAEKFPINHRWGVGAKWKFVTGRRNAICNARSRFHENIQNSL